MTFKFLKMEINKKGRRKFHKVRSGREETVSRAPMIKCRSFYSKMMRPSSQFSTAFKIVKSRYQRGNRLRTINMKIFIENAQEGYVRVVEKRLKPTFQVRFLVSCLEFLDVEQKRQTKYGSNNQCIKK